MRVMPFDQHQRYEVVGTLAGSMPTVGTPIALDVGGFFSAADAGPTLPIREVLPAGWRAVTLDRQVPAHGACQGYTIGDAGRLPFEDGTFDLVSCLDVLEHVPPEWRPPVMADLLRVSRGYVVIAVPFADDDAAQRELALSAFLRRALGTDHPYLEEHRAFGLPTHAALAAALPDRTWSFGFGNLDRWFAMMLAKHFLLALPHAGDPSARLDAAYLQLDRDHDRRGPFYRRYYLTTSGDGVSIDPIASTADRYRELDTGSNQPFEPFLAWVFDRLLDAERDRFTDASAQVLRERDQVTALLRDVEQSNIYKLYRMARAVRSGSRTP